MARLSRARRYPVEEDQRASRTARAGVCGHVGIDGVHACDVYGLSRADVRLVLSTKGGGEGLGRKSMGLGELSSRPILFSLVAVVGRRKGEARESRATAGLSYLLPSQIDLPNGYHKDVSRSPHRSTNQEKRICAWVPLHPRDKPTDHVKNRAEGPMSVSKK